MKKLFGALSLVFGLLIVGWFLYNIIWPMESFKRSFLVLFQLGFPLAAIALGWHWLFAKGPSITEMDIDWESDEIKEAKRRARETMPRFISQILNHKDGVYIKFPFTTDQDVVEHVWGYVHHFEDGVFNMSLVNALYTQEAEMNTRFDVREDEVEDWQIMYPDGSIEGGWSYIGAFKYLENRRIRLSKKQNQEKSQLLSVHEWQ